MILYKSAWKLNRQQTRRTHFEQREKRGERFEHGLKIQIQPRWLQNIGTPKTRNPFKMVHRRWGNLCQVLVGCSCSFLSFCLSSFSRSFERCCALMPDILNENEVRSLIASKQEWDAKRWGKTLLEMNGPICSIDLSTNVELNAKHWSWVKKSSGKLSDSHNDEWDRSS